MHVIIDAMNFLHRSRAGGLGGERAVLFNSCRNLRAELERHNASACTLVWEGRPIARHALIPGEYKANRVQIPGSQEDTKLKAFFEQVDSVREFIAQYLPLRGVYNPSHEADDVIAALGRESAASEPTVIVSSDTDFTQLAGLHERLYVWSPRIKDYLSHPGYDYTVWKALRGDSADNVEGFPGVGDVTATALARDPERLLAWLDASPGRWEKYSVNLRLIRFFSPAEVLPGTVTAFGQTGSAYSPEGCREAFRQLGFESLRSDRYLSRWHDTFGKLRTW